MGITQCVNRAVQQDHAGIVTRFGRRTRRWGEFAERVARLAGGFRALGVEPGNRVAILALNSDRYLEFYAAVPWAGAAAVPLNTHWSPPESIKALNDSGATVLMVDDAFASKAEAIVAGAGSVRAVIHMGDAAAPSGMTSYEHLIERAAPIPDAGRTGDDLAGIFYTGGTTGFPKGVMLSHRSLWASAAAAASVVAWRRDDVALHVGPMFHLATFSAVMGTLLIGAQHVIIAVAEPERVLEAIAQNRVTTVVLVPSMIRLLLTHPKVTMTDLSSLRYLIYGDSPMPEALLREAMRALPACQFVQVYGQTELSPIGTILTPEYHTFEGPRVGKLASAGRAAACCEVQVVSAAGVAVPAGTVGEIRVRGFNTMLGYWNMPEETAARLRDGWVYTGDVGRMDEDGFLYVVDRKADVIVSGGENVYTTEVENACASHTAVSQCAVIGIPDEQRGEAVHAIVILKDGQHVSAEDLVAHCRGVIAGYKCPRSVEFRVGPLPMSALGKVLKRELRKPYWEGRNRQVNRRW